MPDDQGDHESNLARRIEELESLLAEQRRHNRTEQPQRAANVPVLDELVTTEDYAEPDREPDADPGQPSGPELDVLAGRLEKKFSMELDETVRILKNNLKANINEELHNQLRLARKNQGKSDIDASEE